jgi:hypothetical protein
MNVRLKFFYTWLQSAYGHPPTLVQARNINGLPAEEDHPFYRLSGGLSDFPPPNSRRHLDEVLTQVTKVESGDLNEYQYEGDSFVHHIIRRRVRFEHAIFGECPEWPIWCCTLAQYKAALTGYRQFLDLPMSIDSELIIELPGGESEDC